MEWDIANQTAWPTDVWQQFAVSRPVVRCSAGYLIYLQGTEATCFYYLRSGRVKSYIQSEDGAQHVLQVFREGALFGEASFLDGLPRVSSAVALTDCQIVPIDHELVVEQISKRPDLAMTMMKYLARKVRVLSQQVDDMAFRPTDQRIARYLLSSPLSTDGSISCSQEEIAAIVTASRVTVSRILNSFGRKGWIKLGYRSCKVLDPGALAALCHI